MIYGMKLAYRKKKLKKLMIRRAYLLGDFKNYRKHQDEYKRMLRKKNYLRSDMIMLGNVSSISNELNMLTRIARDDKLYAESIQALKNDIDAAKKG